MDAKTRRLMDAKTRANGFDVTCTIGHVSFSEASEHTAHEEAFLLIARHDAPGEFHFPTSDGRECVVTVAGSVYDPRDGEEM